MVGGGLSGLAAAEALARHHHDRFAITILEAKRILGGRAGSFTDPSNGEVVDYCQHVAMGCCTNLIGLLERCGLAGSMQRYSELRFLYPGCSPSRFAPSRYLPAPLHLAGTIGALRHLTQEQRHQIRRGLWRLFRSPSEQMRNQSAAQWLAANAQDAETIRRFWSVFVVSALGEQTDVVAMSAVRQVFVDGFAAARGASDVLVPTLPLAELFGRRLRSAIENLGVKICTGQAATSVLDCDDGIRVETSDGRHHEADHVISAVPWHRVASLLPQHAKTLGLNQVTQFPVSSITGLHLWFDREITDCPHAVMVETVSQWLFRQPFRNRDSDSGYYYQVVISASQHARSIPKEQLVETVVGELRRAFPLAAKANLLHSRIVSDPQSVFSIRPEVEAVRPAARTALPWLHLAGDWIATLWPSTMEGAVIGGRMAASSASEQESLGSIAIDSGLPRGWLARQIIKP